MPPPFPCLVRRSCGFDEGRYTRPNGRPWRLDPERVPAALDRGEGRPAPGYERHDRQSRTPGQGGYERGATVEERTRALDLEGDQGPDALGRRRGHEVRFLASEPREVLLQQVDAAAAEVLAHVLEVLGDLEGAADRVRELDALRRRRVEYVEDHVADRVGRELAVAEQVLEGGVGARRLVHPV